jgi:glyoxylate reductase
VSDRVFVTRPIADAAIRRLAQSVRVDLWDDDLPPPHDELITRLRRADGVLSMVSDRLDATAIATPPRLIAISNLAVGVDNIDLEAATRAGVAVGHTPGILTETTADLAFAMMMAAARRIAESDRFVRAGRWRAWTPRLMLGRDIWGATLGIIGFGAIGKAVARRAAGFGMRVLCSRRDTREANPAAQSAGGDDDRPMPIAEPVDLARLLAESDFISLHVPLNDRTVSLIGARELARMKPGAILVNTARGAVVDQKALAVALKSGRLAAAALDVFATEPLPADDPLMQLPNVVLTPHIGSASHATRSRMAELAVDNLLDVFAGRLPRRCANPGVTLKERPSAGR